MPRSFPSAENYPEGTYSHLPVIRANSRHSLGVRQRPRMSFSRWQRLNASSLLAERLHIYNSSATRRLHTLRGSESTLQEIRISRSSLSRSGILSLRSFGTRGTKTHTQ